MMVVQSTFPMTICRIETRELEMVITGTYLKLSTSHIHPKSNQWLSDDEQGVLAVFDKHIYGYWILVPDAEADLKDVPDDLQHILRFASELGCSWIMLDGDGQVIEELPTYDWE
ncbi:DUF5983 family protein [Paenibacillus sp. GYB003]|uniref:DUF5983 family protein n=1 Tax=Paenibacillus sp. GYB003 TaxID=2994392 RepID=UPI003FA7A332